MRHCPSIMGTPASQERNAIMSRFVNIAACQFTGSLDPEANLMNMIRMVREAAGAQRKLDVIIFPEYSYNYPTSPEEAGRLAVDLEKPHPFLDAMRFLAKEYHVNLIPGSFVGKAANGKVTNTLIFINREGEIVTRYDKMHLMVAAGFDESASVAYGDHLSVFDTDFGRIGMMVCYDLRFPEQARSMCLDGAEIIFVPACFPSGLPLPTRVDDWDILVKGTALVNMTYVVGCNQFGFLDGDNHFGRTCVIDPRGITRAMASGCEDIIFSTIDLDFAKKSQETMGVWRNRRPEMYKLG